VSDSKTLEDEFWLYAGDMYARDGVAAILLDWQDRWGANVNTVLLCLWSANRGRCLAPGDFEAVAQAVAGWHAAAIVPLRRLRQRLKVEWTGLAPNVEPTRQAILASELQAERSEQAIMVHTLSPWSARVDLADEGLARQNLLTYLKNADVVTEAGAGAEAVAALLARIG
jgi:uncharacterized protein (TIGR02444 family)